MTCIQEVPGWMSARTLPIPDVFCACLESLQTNAGILCHTQTENVSFHISYNSLLITIWSFPRYMVWHTDSIITQTVIELMNEVNTKVILIHAMKACRRRRVIAPLILNLGARRRWVVNIILVTLLLGKNRSTNCIGAIMDVEGMNVWLNERTNEWIYQSINELISK